MVLDISMPCEPTVNEIETDDSTNYATNKGMKEEL